MLTPSNCPLVFYNNCANYQIKCKLCVAHRKNLERPLLLYKPIISAEGLYFTQHPCFVRKTSLKKEVDKKARAYNRKGHTIERKVMKEVGAKLTYNSGATNGDGDGTLTINGTKYHLSHKQRFNNRNTLGPTSKEWEEKGIDIWITSSEERGQIVTMSVDVFKELIDGRVG